MGRASPDLLTFCSSSWAFATFTSAEGGFWLLTSSSMSATQASRLSSVSWARSVPAASSRTGTARRDTWGERWLSRPGGRRAAVGQPWGWSEPLHATMPCRGGDARGWRDLALPRSPLVSPSRRISRAVPRWAP